MITEASEKEKLPVFQKMVLFREKPDRSALPYIRGLLNNNPNNLVISKKELQSLSGRLPGAEKDLDEIRRFYDHYEDILEPHLRETYVFNENIITKEPSGLSEYEAKKALLKLRHYTYSQNQMYIGLDPDAHRIAKKLQGLPDDSDQIEDTLASIDDCQFTLNIDPV